MKRAYKYRIYPTEDQKKYFAVCFAANRWWWNYCLEKIEKVYTDNKGKEKGERKKIPSAQYEIGYELPILKKTEETAWLKKADSTSFICTGENLDKALDRFFKDKNVGFPKQKVRKYSNSYTGKINKSRQNIIDWKKGLIYINKIGNVKIVLHRKFKGEIKSTTISKKSFDYYEVSILVDDTYVKEPLREHTKDGTVGIDMGSKDSKKGGNAILSDGTRFNVINIKKEEQKLKKLQRKLAKKTWFKIDEKKYSKKYKREVDVKVPSKNYIKLKNKIAKIEDKIAKKREYNTHQISSYVSKNEKFDTIVIEDLNVKGMLKNKRSSKSITNGNMGELKRQIEYKCDWYGKNVVKVNRWYASTKTCSVCGEKYEVGEKRTWVCPKCGTKHDRDINAAINIKEEGIRILSEGKQ